MSARTSAAAALPFLNVSTIDQEPFITRKITNQGEQYAGFLFDLLNDIGKEAGFIPVFKQASDGRFGSDRPTGWTGVIGDVVSRKVEIGAAALTVTPEREEAVDFTKSFLSDSVVLLVKKPGWSDLGLSYLVRPFSADYWVMFLVVLFLIGIVFFIIGKFSPYEWGNVAADRDFRGAKNSFTLRNSYLFAFSTLSWQGFREAPHSLSGRIMAAFWWMFVLFTLIAYTANLTVYMLSRPEQIPEMPFKTYDELIEKSDIRVGSINFGSTQSLLYNSRSDSLKALWTKINSQDAWVTNHKEGIHRVKTSNGKFVLLLDTATAEYVARRNCELMIYGENLFPSSLAFALPKGSEWKIKINNALQKLTEDGRLEQLREQYWRFNGECLNIDGRTFVESGGRLSSLPIYPISLKDMSVAILLLFLGFIASMVFLFIEVVHYAVTKQGKKIERPKILKNRPKIFRPKAKAAKAEPAAEEEQGEPGPSSDGLDSVPIEDAEEPGTSAEEGEKAPI
uniref:Ionotropic glutamate receptor C-terminal domain-containing protein n=1 Tax=Arion vulgaris TaxID=1028688 RepID=A0A0B7B4D5_9EUPU